MSVTQSDGLVLFGASGDLAYKMIFPSLAAMERRGRLNVPVIGVARTKWTLKQFRARVADSVREHGTPADRKALPALLRRMGYVAGEYNKRSTYWAISRALGSAERPPTTWRSRPACSRSSWMGWPAPAARRTPVSSSRSRSGATARRRAS
jgi:glucose-6-phosphate 1-dehydrogenase